ncbi:MAG: rod shape-determining protein MreC [Candidatus Angelobacter sp. Gp1-AA117]|nr:MAG: rod shape-determining protein MreC [Candidatus Angelobacter sp. Gp1-AA117]
MESFFSRYKNPLVLMAVLFIQVVGLATQVKRDDPHSGRGIRLIRIWSVSAITPVERAFVGTGHFFRNTWHNYIDLHDVRKQNRDLQAELDRMRLEQARLREDAEQGRRLQALLGFREKLILQSIVAQVIGSSGSEQSHIIQIDKGYRAGIKTDMAVITPDGIVGKVKEVFPLSSQVLMINDKDSGAGVILQRSRLQGIIKGTNKGELFVSDIMSDEKVEPGEQVITSGGDRIYPKGLPVGTVINAGVDHEAETFLAIKVKPSANLNRLEEVLVITKIEEQVPTVSQEGTRVRAADILAERLPTVPKKPEKPDDKTKPAGTTTVPGTPDQHKKTGASATNPNGARPPSGAGNAGVAPSPGPPTRAGVARGGVESPSAVGNATNKNQAAGTPKNPADSATKKTGASNSPGTADQAKNNDHSAQPRAAVPHDTANKGQAAGTTKNPADSGTKKPSTDTKKKPADGTAAGTPVVPKPKKPDQPKPSDTAPPDISEKPPR